MRSLAPDVIFIALLSRSLTAQRSVNAIEVREETNPEAAQTHAKKAAKKCNPHFFH